MARAYDAALNMLLITTRGGVSAGTRFFFIAVPTRPAITVRVLERLADGKTWETCRMHPLVWLA